MQRWQRLGAAIKAERMARGFRRRKDFAAVSGVSLRTLADLEKGERTRYTDATLQAVESACGWAPGSVEQILQGRQPTRMVDEDLQRITDLWATMSPATRRAARTIVEVIARLG